MSLIALVTVVMLGMQAASPAGAPPQDAVVHPSVELPAPLARVLTDYERAWTQRDAEGLARLFADDGWVLSRGTPPIRGRAAIARHYANQGGRLSLRALAFQTEGQVGFILGAFTAVKGEPDMGKFTLTLRRGADGHWLIVSDMDNNNSNSR